MELNFVMVQVEPCQLGSSKQEKKRIFFIRVNCTVLLKGRAKFLFLTQGEISSDHFPEQSFKHFSNHRGLCYKNWVVDNHLCIDKLNLTSVSLYIINQSYVSICNFESISITFKPFNRRGIQLFNLIEFTCTNIIRPLMLVPLLHKTISWKPFSHFKNMDLTIVVAENDIVPMSPNSPKYCLLISVILLYQFLLY